MANDDSERTTPIGRSGVDPFAPAPAIASPAGRSIATAPDWAARRRARVVDVHPNSMAARKWGRREWVSLHDEQGRPRST
jgi:hypothetical protein